MRVVVANETDEAIAEARLIRAVRAALAPSGFTEGDVSVAIVSDEVIHQLNREFLAHDYPTDVLSFGLSISPPRLEGEIVASFDTAERNAREAGWHPDEELLLYVVHAALHLAGYRDEQPTQAADMRRAELAVLDQLGVRPGPSDDRWSDLQPALPRTPTEDASS
jgi:probable rRNA maturation factor